MLIYIVILSLLYFVGLGDVKGIFKKKQKKEIFVFVFVFFWILSFIRWETGTDWDSYHECFVKNYTLYDFQQRGFEPYYTYLNFYVKKLSDSYWVFLMTCGLIIFPLTGSTIYKYSPLPFISLLTYLLIRRADIFFVRESIALAFCFYSIRYIETGKLFKFILCVLIGSQFHNSVFVFLPAYYIFKIKIKPKIIISSLLGLFVLMLVLQESITATFGQIASVMGESFLDKTDKYLERGYETGGASSVASAMIRGFINRGIFLVYFFYAYKVHKGERKVNGLLNLYAISIAIFIILAPFSLTLNRVANSYEMASILLIGYSFDKMPKKYKKIMYILYFSYITVRFITGTLYGVYSHEFLPYKTIFNQ